MPGAVGGRPASVARIAAAPITPARWIEGPRRRPGRRRRPAAACSTSRDRSRTPNSAEDGAARMASSITFWPLTASRWARPDALERRRASPGRCGRPRRGRSRAARADSASSMPSPSAASGAGPDPVERAGRSRRGPPPVSSSRSPRARATAPSALELRAVEGVGLGSATVASTSTSAPTGRSARPARGTTASDPAGVGLERDADLAEAPLRRGGEEAGRSSTPGAGGAPARAPRVDRVQPERRRSPRPAIAPTAHEAGEPAARREAAQSRWPAEREHRSRPTASERRAAAASAQAAQPRRRGERAARPAGPLTTAGRAAWRRQPATAVSSPAHGCRRVAQRLHRRRADARDLVELVDRGDAAVLVAEVDDVLRP